MKKYFLLIFILFSVSFIKINAQTDVIIGAGSVTGTTANGAATDAGPIYCTGSSSSFIYSKHFIVYTAAELSNAGIQPGMLITNLAWNKANDAAYSASTAVVFDIYMKNSSATGVPTPVPQDFASLVSGATLVYASTTQSFPSTIGWVNFTLTTPFLYTGGAIEMATNWDVSAGGSTASGATANFAWAKDPGFNILSYCAATQSPNLTNLRTSRAQIKITFTPGGSCTVPPIAGTANSNKTNTCIGETFSLGLTGNSSGIGQTYKWQSSLTGNAPWTDVSLAQASPSFSTNQNISTYYRCMVTCSGNSVYSDSLQILTPVAVNGTYSINSALPTGGSNFATFAEAFDYIKCGINGPVVFNVAVGSGPYALSAPLNIPVIYGATSTNTVTINGNGESITYNTVDANNRAAIVLNGTDHLILDSLTIDVSAGTYGVGIQFMNNADSNIVRKSTILTNTSATSTNYAGIIFSSSVTSATTAGSNGNDNLIENNRIVGGYYSITLVGATTTDLDSNNVIKGNLLEDFYFYGIYTLYQKNATIKSNNISRPLRTTVSSFYPVYLSTGNIGSLIEGNKIHNGFTGAPTSTSIMYGIYCTSDGTLTSPNLIVNNLIYNNEGNGTHYGIYNSGGAYMKAYHNTIALDYVGATAGATYGFYQITSDNGIEFKNNIVYITRGGTGLKYGIYKSTAATPLVSNNNIFYLGSAGSGAQSIGFQTSAQASLTDWQTASSQDVNSMVADPLFTNPSVGDYLQTESSIDNIGDAVGVLTDITGKVRSLTTPDAGAYEYTAPVCVAPPTAGTVNSSSTNVCVGETFSLGLTGNSSGTGQTYKWQYSLTGNAPWTDVDIASTSPLYSHTQSVSTYYRCMVTCSGNSVYSDSLQIISPVLVSGSYTINSALPTSGSNFASFAEAFDYIKCGINGPVVFNVAVGSGPYALTAPLNIPVIYGATSTNTVTINGNGESITYNTVDANNRAAIVLNGTDHLILDSLTIDVSAGTYGVGIQFMNYADSNIVRKSTILTNTSATTTNYAGIVFSSAATPTTAGSNGNDNLIENNRIVGGYYSITLVGTSTTDLDSNNVIKGNLLEDFYFYGIYTLYQKNATIKSNNISRPLRTTVSSFYPVYLSTGNIGSLVEGNKIHNGFTGAPTSTSIMYGIYCTSDGTLTSPNLIVNNLIYNNEGNGTHYGIYNSGGAYMKAYHNTIALDYVGATAGATYGLYQVTSADGIEFKNNIVYITRGGTGAKYGIYKSTAATPLVSNNNIFYLGSAGSGAQSIGYQTSAQASLTAWQTASSQDLNSMVADPLFANPSSGDYLQTESTIDDKGASVGVLTDINGTLRSTTTPDPGAYELPPSVGIDMKAEALVSPTVSVGNCYNTETLTVRVGNNSVDSINFVLNPLTVTINVTGAATATYTAIVNTGKLAPDSSLNVTMTTPGATLNMSTAGTYDFAISTSVTGDVNSANNNLTAQRTKQALTAGTASVTPDTLCATSATLPVLDATTVEGYTSVRWQRSSTSGSGFTDISGATSINYTLLVQPTATYYYRLVATCGATDVNSTEALMVYNNPQILTAITDTTCGAGSVTLTATGTGTDINWYANATGGTALATGNSYTTTISTTTTFYAAASNGGSSNITIPGDGAWDHVTTSGSFQATTITSAYMILTVLQPLTLSSMDIYPSAALGTAFTIEARTVSASGAMFLNYSGTTTVQNSGTPTVAQTVPINWVLPAGTYYIGFTSNPSTWRSGLFTHSFPWVAAGLASVDYYLTPSYQYYFYNLKLSTGCESARTPLVALVDNDPGCGVVPVTYTMFTGKREGMVNMLSWQTATESNNIGFELQRSSDGKQFSKLSFVNSKAVNGNSTSNVSYGYNDVKPLAGTNYYRLKQIDKDGKFNYSTVVILKGDKVSQISIASVYPNPVRNTINVQIVSPANEKVSLVITDITGKVLMQENTSLTAGDNVKQIDVSRLSQGAYLIKAICNNGCETAVFKFTKY